MGGKTAVATAARVRRLATHEARFYEAFAESQHLAFTVLHLQNPDDISTWTLVACNVAARKLFGSSVSSHLRLPMMPLLGGEPKREESEIYRSAILSGKTRWLGQIMQSSRGKPSRVFSVRAYPYPHNCVGVICESGERTPIELFCGALRGQEEDRKRISRELHDSVGQIVAALKWKLVNCQRQAKGRGRLSEIVNECLELAKECQDEIRAVSYALRPPALEALGLEAALEWQAKRFAQQSELQVKLDVQPGIGRLGPDSEIALFRAFQESISNVLRHAQTNAALAWLRSDGTNVILEVQDEGVGIPRKLFEDLESGRRGIGLLKMRERLAELGGRLEIESEGNGTLVRASVPRRARS